MIIFLPRIPNDISKAQLRNFSANVLSNKLNLPFSSTPILNSCEILSISGPNNTEEHHGLISITPESAGRWFIRHVKGKMLGKKRILARQHLDRESDGVAEFPPENDRRDPHATKELIDAEEKVQVQAMEQYKKEYH